MLKELLEVVYDPKPIEWEDASTATRIYPTRKKPATSASDEARKKRRRTLTTKAREIMDTSMDDPYTEKDGAGNEDDGEAYEYDRMASLLEQHASTSASTGAKRKTKYSPYQRVPTDIKPDGKTAILCSDASITNQTCIRCRYCKQDKVRRSCRFSIKCMYVLPYPLSALTSLHVRFANQYCTHAYQYAGDRHHASRLTRRRTFLCQDHPHGTKSL